MHLKLLFIKAHLKHISYVFMFPQYHKRIIEMLRPICHNAMFIELGGERKQIPAFAQTLNHHHLISFRRTKNSIPKSFMVNRL